MPSKKEGASRVFWKYWNDYRNLRMENELSKRVKSIGNFNNFTLIVIQRLILIEIYLFFMNNVDFLVWQRHLIGFKYNSTC